VADPGSKPRGGGRFQ